MLVYQRVNHVKPPLTGHVPSHVMTGPRPLRFAKERVCFGSDARNASVGTPGWIFCQGLPLAEKSTWHKWSDFHIQWIFMDNHDLYIHICIHCIWYIYTYIYPFHISYFYIILYGIFIYNGSFQQDHIIRKSVFHFINCGIFMNISILWIIWVNWITMDFYGFHETWKYNGRYNSNEKIKSWMTFG